MSSIYIKIDDVWFDFTTFKTHPGGSLKKYHMKDCTDIFYSITGHNVSVIYDIMMHYEIHDKILIDKLDKLEKIFNLSF